MYWVHWRVINDTPTLVLTRARFWGVEGSHILMVGPNISDTATIGILLSNGLPYGDTSTYRIGCGMAARSTTSIPITSPRGAGGGVTPFLAIIAAPSLLCHHADEVDTGVYCGDI
jgi:hypothetical protein